LELRVDLHLDVDEPVALVLSALRNRPVRRAGCSHRVAGAPRVMREAVDRAPDERGEQQVVSRPAFGRHELASAGDRHPAREVDLDRVFEGLGGDRHRQNLSVRSGS
jgi:hypothetical protein